MASLSFYRDQLSPKLVDAGEDSNAFQALNRSFSIDNIGFVIDKNIPLALYFTCNWGHCGFWHGHF